MPTNIYIVFVTLSVAAAVHVQVHPPPPKNLVRNLTYNLTCKHIFEALDQNTSDMLDEPALACAENKSNIMKRLIRGDWQPKFQSTHLEGLRTDKDHAEEILVVGPESSGTTFIKHVLHQSLNIVHEIRETDWKDLTHCPQDSTLKTVLHFSNPCFGNCDRNLPYLAVLDNLGCLISTASPLKRSLVNMSSAVMAHRQVQKKINIVQVVRDPRASLLSKIRKHCGDNEAAAAEQSLAYDLMVEAKDMPEVTTICYEDMVQSDGAAYLETKLGPFNVKAATVPTIVDSNVVYSLDVPTLCGHDERAYMQLCPESPFAAALKGICK